MSDDKKKTGEPDRSRINLNESYERQYWRDKFGVTDKELEDAVAAAGTNADDIERHLKRNK